MADGSSTPVDAAGRIEGEKPVSGLSWSETRNQLRNFSLMRAGGKDLREENLVREASLKARKEQLIGKMKEAGHLDDIDTTISKLKEDVRTKGDSARSEIKEELSRGVTVADAPGMGPEYDRIRTDYFKEQLEALLEGSETNPVQHSSGPEANKTNNETRIREINREMEEKRRIIGDLSISEVERGKAFVRLDELNKEYTSLVSNLDNGYYNENGEFVEFDERGREGRLQHKFEDDPEAFQEEFEQLLQYLIENQKQKNFDSDRQQTMTLDRALRDLPVKGTFVYKGVTYNYASERSKLTERLNAFRSGHNSIFLYQNVSQLSDLIRVMDQLKGETENYLTHDPDIARAFRGLAKLLEGSEEEQKLVAAFIKEKVVIDKDGKPIPPLGKDGKPTPLLLDEQGRPIPYWAIRLAGGLICAQHLAAGADVSLNQSGDFFQNRLFNSPNRARNQWHKVLGRPENFELYKALDLQVTGVWEARLEKKINKMLDKVEGIEDINKDIENTADPKEIERLEEQGRKLKVTKSQDIKNEFVEFCKRIGITAKGGGEINPEFDEKRGVFTVKRGTFSLSQIKLEEIDINAVFGLAEDQTRQVYLDLADADAVRKLLFDPGCFIEVPTPSALSQIWKVMKHLKGDDRSEWFAGVLKETVNLYKEQKNWLTGIATSEAKKFMPGTTTLNNEAINNLVESFRPLINEGDVRQIIVEVTGRTSEQIKAWELTKLILELILTAAEKAFESAVATEGIKLSKSK